MERQNLQKHVRTLITLPVADAPVISCYQALAAGVWPIETRSTGACGRFGGA